MQLIYMNIFLNFIIYFKELFKTYIIYLILLLFQHNTIFNKLLKFIPKVTYK